jgi:hypothetical protein
LKACEQFFFYIYSYHFSLLGIALSFNKNLQTSFLLSQIV